MSESAPWEDYQENQSPAATETADTSKPWEAYQQVTKGDSYYLSDTPNEESEWDNFWYSFNKVKTFTESAGDVMEQHIPLGRIQVTNPETGDLDIKYVPPSEELKAAAKAGDEEWAAAILSAERDQRLKQRFSYLYSPEGEAPESGVAGTMVGAIVDPTTLIPLGHGIKAMTAIGAGIGALDGALYSKGKTGKVDPTHVGLGATIGAIAPAVLKGAGKTLGFGRTKLSQKVADDYLNRYEKYYTESMARGDASDMADVYAKAESGIYNNGVPIEELYKATGRTAPAISDAVMAKEALATIEEEAGRNFLSKGVLAVGKAIEPFVGTTSTRLRGISSRIFHTVRKADMQQHIDTHKYFSEVEGFARNVQKIQARDKGLYDSLKKALYQGDFDGVTSIMNRAAKEAPKDFGKFGDDWAKTRSVLDELYEGYKGMGYKLKKEEFFFPRIVKSPEGLGVIKQSIIKKALDTAAKAKKRDLTQAETAQVINSLIRRGVKDTATAKVSKSVRARKFDFMEDEMLPHYAEVNDSLHAYIRQAVNDINRQKWLRTHGVGVKSKKGVDPSGRDLEWGLGHVVAKEAERLNLSADQSNQLLGALRARFGKGEMGSSMGIQHFKNLSYGTTLGNIFSAITQLGDNAFGMYLNGVRNHLSGMFGRKLIKKTMIGLSDISEDLMNDVSKTKKFLDFTLKWSGFSKLDQFGKESLLNGAMKKYNKQLKTDAGRREFVAKWGRYFDNDTPKLMKELKAGNFDDDNVRLLLWHTLADIQPIGLSEMPEKYLNHPNGRVFYMLKTFTIKQFDIMRREIIHEALHGDKAKAASNAARFAVLFGLINGSADMLKDTLAGKEIDINDTMVDNMIKLIGISRYQTSQMAKDGPMQVLLETLLPPVPFIDKPATAALQGKPEKALEAVPLVGKLAAKHLKE